MWEMINQLIIKIDDLVWGVPLMVLILSGGLLLLLERRLGCFGLCLPGGRRFRLRRLARCTRGKAECQQQRKSKVFSYSHDGSSP